MTLSRPTPTRWSVTVVGLAFVVVALAGPVVRPVARFSVPHAILPAVLAVGVVAVGVKLAYSPVADRFVVHAAAWTILGALGTAAAGAWTLSMNPVPVDTTNAILGFNLIAGGFAGSLVGLTSARSRHRATELEAQRERLSFLNYLLRHNVLNGVQVVDSQTTALRDAVPSDEHGRVEVIESWTNGLADLVDRMRLFLDASTGDSVLEPTSLEDVVTTEASKVTGAYDAAVTTNVHAATVTADDGLHQVFECILVDVVERSEVDAPTIDVTAEPTGDVVRVDVTSPDPVASTDGGVNFDKHNDDPTGDLGFGRYLVATLVDYYGGTVTTDDDDVVYTLELPRAPDPPTETDPGEKATTVTNSRTEDYS